MKICVVYNRQSRRVINLFGIPNREKYGREIIRKIAEALKHNGHIVHTLEGDKDLISKLEDFMPGVLKGERPGMVFNLSYGIQGQARYTHVPSILEMVGIPYVGSGPLSHSLSLDKVVSKMLFQQHGIPTPAFGVVEDKDSDMPQLKFPLVVKPKNEAVSMGLAIVNDEENLRRAAETILEEFNQAVLVEEYIEGREINVGLLGNSPCLTFAPLELIFPEDGPAIYTADDKRGKSGRQIKLVCPADLPEEITRNAQAIAVKTFKVLQCCDCARVDMRLDKKGNLYVLELNSLPSLGMRGSYVNAARLAGLDFEQLVNRLVEVASARYFGTPRPPALVSSESSPDQRVFSFLTAKRDVIMKQLKYWVSVSSRTSDSMGIGKAFTHAAKAFEKLKLVQMEDCSDEQWVRTWQTKAGLEKGTLLIVHLDVPLEENIPLQEFKREPERLCGEGIACSRAPLVAAIFSLSSLYHIRQLHKKRLGILLYADEGLNCRHSRKTIEAVTSNAAEVLVLRPGNPGDKIVTNRRGQRVYRLTVEGTSRRLESRADGPDLMGWTYKNIETVSKISLQRKRLSMALVSLETSGFAMKMPHRITAEILLTYYSTADADQLCAEFEELLQDGSFAYHFELLSERPPLQKRSNCNALGKRLGDIAQQWDIPLHKESSSWPSAAGLVPDHIPVVCGLGPVGVDLYTPHESISRISLAQRTLLLAEFLITNTPDKT